MAQRVYNPRSGGRSFSPPRRRLPTRLIGQLVTIAVVCLGAATHHIWSNGVSGAADSLPRLVSGDGYSQGAKVVRVAGNARKMPICGSGKRSNCVVDGDTLWLDGEKIRIEGMNAPETKGDCAHERKLAERATRRLSELLSSKSITIERNGADVYGRTLATVRANGRDVAPAMVDEGLAHVWRGYKENWCS